MSHHQPNVLPLVRSRLDGRPLSWLADWLGYSRDYLSHMLAGRRRLPPATAQRISDKLGIPLAELTGGDAAKTVA